MADLPCAHGVCHVHMANGRRAVSLPNTDGQHQSMADRYGVPSPYARIVTVALLTLLAAAFLGWLIWAALDHAASPAQPRVRSYDVVSPHEIRVVLDVRRPENAALVCTVTAQAEDHSVVGEKVVRVPPGEDGELTMRVSVTTDREATTADISGCS